MQSWCVVKEEGLTCFTVISQHLPGRNEKYLDTLEKEKPVNHPKYNLHGCTVHVDNVKSFIYPTNAHIKYSKIYWTIKNF